MVEENFGDWLAPTEALPPLVYPPLPGQPGQQRIPQATNQAIVIVGYPAPAIEHPAYAALKLASTYLGNGLSSRLFVELREKRGLAYDVSAFYPTRLGMSQFVSYMCTAPENAAIALESLQFETERLAAESLTAEELESSKNKLLGQYALGKQTNGQIAQLLGWYEVLGLGAGFDKDFQAAVAAVTQQEVQAAAQAYFQQPHTVILGPM